jgi:hypothetical protein
MTPEKAIRRLVRDVAARNGRPQAADLVGIARSSAGVTLTLDSDQVSRRTTTVTVDDDLVRDLETGGPIALELRARASDLVRLEARRDALGGDGSAPPPPWSVSVPRLFAHVLGRCGRTPEDLLDGIEAHSGWEGTALGPRENVEISSASVRSGRLVGNLDLRSGTALVTVSAGDDEDGHCTVAVHGVDLPELALERAIGMPLAQVVDHADLADCPDQRVAYVRRRGTKTPRLDFTLTPDFAWCGEAPPGADVSWRGIREGRRLPVA